LKCFSTQTPFYQLIKKENLMKVLYKIAGLLVFSFIFILNSTKANTNNTNAICKALIAVPSNYTQIKSYISEGGKLDCKCPVRQKTEFVSMNQTIVSFYDTQISEYTIKSNGNQNVMVETVEVSPLYLAISREDYSLLRFLFINGINFNIELENNKKAILLELYKDIKESLVF